MQIRLLILSILNTGQEYSSQSKDRYGCSFTAPIKAGSEKLERIAVKIARSVLGRLGQSNLIWLFDESFAPYYKLKNRKPRPFT